MVLWPEKAEYLRVEAEGASLGITSVTHLGNFCFSSPQLWAPGLEVMVPRRTCFHQETQESLWNFRPWQPLVTSGSSCQDSMRQGRSHGVGSGATTSSHQGEVNLLDMHFPSSLRNWLPWFMAEFQRENRHKRMCFHSRLCPSLGVTYNQRWVNLGVWNLSLLAQFGTDLKDHQVPMTESLLGLQHSSATPCLDADITASQVVFLRALPNKPPREISTLDSASQGSQAKQDGSGTCQINSWKIEAGI